MKFNTFTTYLEEIQELSSRNEMTVKLAELFNQMTAEEIDKATYMMQGRVAPAFLPIEFNFSNTLILRALGSFFNISFIAIEKEYKFLGDIGLVSLKFKNKNIPQNPELVDVYRTLERIAASSGKNSQSEKAYLFLEQAKKLTPIELKYFCRILTGTLRLGLSVKTILDSLSWSISGSKEHKKILENAYGVRCDLGSIAKLIKAKDPIKELKSLNTKPGVPVASKLVEREKSIPAIVERMGAVYVQPKYDGLRLQIHYSKKGFEKPLHINSFALFEDSELLQDKIVDHVRLFSRNLENITDMFPELAEDVARLDVDSFILDGEAIGFDPSSNDFLDFQETIKRKRKYNIESISQKFPIEVHVFDILELNGKDLLHIDIKERLKILEDLKVTQKTKHFKLTQTDLVQTTEEVEKLFKKYADRNLEGIIAKDEGTYYLPGTRNFDWIKFKTSYTKGIEDSIDTVVLGYYYGAGLRTRFGIGAILVGVYDAKKDMYVSLAKVGTGMKDDDWPKIKQTLNNIIVTELPKNVLIDKQVLPDVIVSPQVVAVIEADSISISKLHNVEEGSETGYSLRFPRLKQFGRDKKAEDATTLEELKRLYELQNSEKFADKKSEDN